jgi:predicted PurR-regulated permease PerM
VLAGLHVMRSVFVPLAFAVMLFFLLRAPVRRLVSWHLPRFVASALVLGLAVGSLSLATLELTGPAVTWAQRLPGAVQELEAKSRSLRLPLEQASRGVQLVRKFVDVEGAEKVPRVAVVRPGALQGVVEGAAELTTQLALTIVCAFFLLLDGDGLLDRIHRLAPSFAGPRRASMLVGEVGRRMSQYLLAVTSINLGLGALVSVSFFLLGMPNPLLWGGLAAVLTYVPYIGPAIGLALVVLASFVSFPTAALAVLPPLVYFTLASLEGNLVTPLVLGHSFRISPLVVFVWLSLWVWLWSVPGAILAVPMLMLIKIVCEENPALAGLGYLLGGNPTAGRRG